MRATDKRDQKTRKWLREKKTYKRDTSDGNIKTISVASTCIKHANIKGRGRKKSSVEGGAGREAGKVKGRAGKEEQKS